MVGERRGLPHGHVAVRQLVQAGMKASNPSEAHGMLRCFRLLCCASLLGWLPEVRLLQVCCRCAAPAAVLPSAFAASVPCRLWAAQQLLMQLQLGD